MKKNIGIKDRFARITLSIIIGIFALFADSLISRTSLILLSLFVLYEALAGWCALYALLGKNTCPLSYEKGKSDKVKQ